MAAKLLLLPLQQLLGVKVFPRTLSPSSVDSRRDCLGWPTAKQLRGSLINIYSTPCPRIHLMGDDKHFPS